MGPILNIVIMNLLFTTLYEVQINMMSNESIIKSVFFPHFGLFREHYIFLYKWDQYGPPLDLLCPYIAFIGPILLLSCIGDAVNAKFQLSATAGNFTSLITLNHIKSTFITLCWLLYYISHTFYLFIYLHSITVCC